MTITICGSLRFFEMMRGYALNRPDTYLLPAPGRVKHFAQEDHRQKIEKADKVLVFNFGGYIGEDTASEIQWAKYYSKPIEYLQPVGEDGECTACGAIHGDNPCPGY